MQTRSRSSRSSSGASAPDPAGASAPKNAAATSSGRIWTEAEEIVMIDFLVARKAEVSDEATFKKPVWNQVSKQFGSRWDADQCQAKWSRLKHEYKVVLQLRSNTSGIVYSEEGGMNIDEHTQEQWDGYVSKFPKASPYKNKSFIHYHRMTPLMPQIVGGKHAFRPSTGARGAAALTAKKKASPEASNPPVEGANDSDSSGAAHPPATPDGGYCTPSASSSAQSSKRKLSALDSVSHSSSRSASTSSKKPRSASASAVANYTMNSTLTNIGDSLRDIAENRKRKAEIKQAEHKQGGSPERRTEAAALLQQQEYYLSSDAMVVLLDLIQDNTKYADTYRTILRVDTRVAWALKRLEELKFEIGAMLGLGRMDSLPKDIREAIDDYIERHVGQQ